MARTFGARAASAAFAVAAFTSATCAEMRTVRVGGMSESPYGSKTVETIAAEGLGDYTVLFCGPWNAQGIRDVAAACRRHGVKFTMDEMFSRRNGGFRGRYADVKDEVIQELHRSRDVLDGCLILCEFGGLAFNWPESTVTGGRKKPPAARTYSEAAANTVRCMRDSIDEAKAAGLPRPYVCIEPTGGCAASHIYRAGIDRIDFEVVYGDDLERRYAAVVGATRAFGKTSFGVDMAMVWYGGNQHDRLWETRWLTSLYHAYLRGADPIYAEHGLMNYQALGKDYGTDHPDVKRFRRCVAKFAAWAKAHPRPAGLPRTAVAIVQGRNDGYVGGWQTHLWGQRLDDRFRIGEADYAWEILDGLYRRRSWENRDKFGDNDYSGNPPLGAVDMLPYDASQECLGQYRLLAFLGRNYMDEALYGKLIEYVRNGGTLLLAASHLDTADTPDAGFTPFRNGDWRELTGVSMVGGMTNMAYGLKFTAEPPCGWRFPLWSPDCDPKFTDGGFAMPVLRSHTAQTLAVASDRFLDGAFRKDMLPVLYANRIGKGTVVFLPATDPIGSHGVRYLYDFLLKSAVEAVDVYPKVECSDRVRYAVYPGKLYVLNTEESLRQEVVVTKSKGSSPVSAMLEPGEMREFDIEEGR